MTCHDILVIKNYPALETSEWDIDFFMLQQMNSKLGIKCYSNLCSLVCRIFVRSEVFMAVTMKNAIFWDVAPCGTCKNRRFRRMYCLHLQGEMN
jgi:hypothetical protein